MPVTSDDGSGAVRIAHRVYELLDTVERFTGLELTYLRPRVLEAAVDTASRLRARTPDEASQRLAHDTCRLLFGNNDPDAGFWTCDLGADIAWHIGYPLPQVPVWAAAAVLRVQRQTIWRLQREHGPLTPDLLRDTARRSRKLRIR